MNVTVIDYGAGNLRSVELALAHLGVTFTVTDAPNLIASADAIVFPGVGDGAHAMRVLAETGIDEAISSAFDDGVPILGICVGCQIVFDRSEEGDAACLGLVPGVAKRFASSAGLKVPHMGWNNVDHHGHWLFEGVEPGSSFYFVHSYYPSPANPYAAIAWTDYGDTFASAIERSSLVAVQFHPEKSGLAGLTVLNNYLRHVGATTAAVPE